MICFSFWFSSRLESGKPTRPVRAELFDVAPDDLDEHHVATRK
jgi:hypothetical protein